jgi:hypothetical protein
MKTGFAEERFEMSLDQFENALAAPLDFALKRHHLRN